MFIQFCTCSNLLLCVPSVSLVFVSFGSFNILLPCIPPSDEQKIEEVSAFQWRVLKNVTIHAMKYVTTDVNMITRELSIKGKAGTIGSVYYVGARYYCVIDTPYGQTIVYTYNVVGWWHRSCTFVCRLAPEKH